MMKTLRHRLARWLCPDIFAKLAEAQHDAYVWQALAEQKHVTRAYQNSDGEWVLPKEQT